MIDLYFKDNFKARMYYNAFCICYLKGKLYIFLVMLCD